MRGSWLRLAATVWEVAGLAGKSNPGEAGELAGGTLGSIVMARSRCVGLAASCQRLGIVRDLRLSPGQRLGMLRAVRRGHIEHLTLAPDPIPRSSCSCASLAASAAWCASSSASLAHFSAARASRSAASCCSSATLRAQLQAAPDACAATFLAMAPNPCRIRHTVHSSSLRYSRSCAVP